MFDVYVALCRQGASARRVARGRGQGISATTFMNLGSKFERGR